MIPRGEPPSRQLSQVITMNSRFQAPQRTDDNAVFPRVSEIGSRLVTTVPHFTVQWLDIDAQVPHAKRLEHRQIK